MLTHPWNQPVILIKRRRGGVSSSSPCEFKKKNIRQSREFGRYSRINSQIEQPKSCLHFKYLKYINRFSSMIQCPHVRMVFYYSSCLCSRPEMMVNNRKSPSASLTSSFSGVQQVCSDIFMIVDIQRPNVQHLVAIGSPRLLSAYFKL